MIDSRELGIRARPNDVRALRSKISCMVMKIVGLRLVDSTAATLYKSVTQSQSSYAGTLELLIATFLEEKSPNQGQMDKEDRECEVGKFEVIIRRMPFPGVRLY